ncbi:MAG TPA: malectin domain-containing carbohydrate-binding protein [Elusimicrobiota bacterium]|nr:malectin domain-containing carbohydrate-binding protein [Elusimicrobiota bacterium]
MGIWKARKAAGVLASVFLAAGGARAEWAGLRPANQSGPSEAYRLNCGAENFDFTDGGGNWWMKDEPFTALYRWGFTGGQAGGQSTADIQGTTEDAIYQTHHYGPAGMAYRLEVPNGRYTVRLHFAA